MLTKREDQILSLTAVGMTPDEIGDALYISPTTVQTTIRNIKKKLHLQKAAELAAHYWCKNFGTSLEEQKRRILASALSICFLMNIPSSSVIIRQRRIVRSHRVRIEHVIQTTA